MKTQRTFVISLVILVGVIFAACAQTSPEELSETERQETEIAAEVIEAVPLTNSEILATNPELKIVDRYADLADEGDTGSMFYAANPELMAAGRYMVPVGEPAGRYIGLTTGEAVASDSTVFAANPELMVAGRYTPTEQVSTSTILAANPELMAARRYHPQPALTDSDILAENPELKVVRRYNAAAE